MTKRLLSLLLVAAPAVAQGSFIPFGQGCTFNNQTLTIGNVGTPQVGTTFDITYGGPNSTGAASQQTAQPFLGLGFGLRTMPIPASLLPQQPAGCMGLIAASVILPTQPDPRQPGYQSMLPFAVPNDPLLVGATFTAQWVTLVDQCGFAGCNLAAILTSDAAICVVGP